MNVKLPRPSLSMLQSLNLYKANLNKGDICGKAEHCFPCLDANPYLQKPHHRKLIKFLASLDKAFCTYS